MKKSAAMRASGLVAAACSVVALMPAAAVAADTPDACEWVETRQVFAFLGDRNEYFLAPNGSFEGTLQWTAKGAVKQKPAPFRLLGRSVVELGAGAELTSPGLCVDVTRPHLRFAVKAPGSGSLRIEAVDAAGVRTLLGRVEAAAQRRERSYAGWSVSPMVPLAPALGISSGAQTVSLRLTAEVGTWDVDSIQVDPMRR